MSLLVAIRHWAPEPWLERFHRMAPEMRVIDAREPFDPDEITFAATWKPEPGLLARLPNLRAIFNLGAGVDALIGDTTLPDVPIVRIVDADLTGRMTEWVVMNVLMHHRRVADHRLAQARASWGDLAQPAARAVRVGIMGMGVLGTDAAEVLARIGFDVAGWSRSGHAVAGIGRFAGEAELPAFLARTDILVVLLPLTETTRGILSRDLFVRLARGSHMGGPVLINAGRGGLQVETDILAALDDGTLAGASLDVFATEPLPATSPLWHHPKIVITPHCAADSDADALGERILAGIRTMERGETLDPALVVDRLRGY